MKTICFTESKISAYLCNDAEFVYINQENIVVGNPIRFIVGDMNSSNATLWENVKSPDDWQGGKYLFDGTTWAKNPDYIEPPVASQGE